MRSLADDLRRRDDEELSEFIRQRADAVNPIPADMSELASQASAAASVRYAIEKLAGPELRVLIALAVADQPASADVVLVPVEQQAELLRIVQRLWAIGLVWGPRPEGATSEVHVVTAARDAIGAQPELPATEVAGIDLSLRPITTSELPLANTLDGQGGQHALAAVTSLSTLAEHWSQHPPTSLKSGGLAVRDVNAVSELLGTDELTAAFWIEVAAEAGLVGPEDAASAKYAPTVYYDTWRLSDPGQQWAPVAAAWLRLDRDIDSVSGQTGDRLSVLAEQPGQAWRRELRSATLQLLSEVEPGQICEFPDLLEHLAERRPRARRDRLEVVCQSTLRESDLLGITARGAITALGRALVEPTVREEQLALKATAILPPVAEEFVAQADLTLVVPGPPSPALRRLLSLVADVESTGGAAVYRVTADSAARALGSGLSPADLIAELNTRSATPLPQPLEYMINDAARRHGGVRVGTTASWISSDDESVIAQLLSDPQAARLGLTRLAPSVIASTAPAEELMTLAASAGHIPTVVGADGESVPLSRPVHRSPDPARKDQPGVDDIFVVALTSALRRSELEEPAGVAIAAPRELPRMPTAATAQVLRRAQTQQVPVWVGYADNAGSMTRRLVDVVATDGGAISAFDHSHGRIRTLVLSRITGAVLAADIASADMDPVGTQDGSNSD